MLLRFHVPSSLDLPGASLQQQRRLQQVIAQSFERAVAALNLPSVQIELVQASIPTHSDRHEPGWQEIQANTPTNSDRHEPAWQETQVNTPTNSDRHEPVQVENWDSAEYIHHADLPTVAVYREEGGTYVYSGECHYKEAKSFAQAIEQGTALFAHSGYAVLQARATDRFSVLQLNPEEQISFDNQAGLSVHPG
ncbi:MAG TPA: hypothetical protein VKX46_08300, partial [Ktedonobacteraceae bacterium]|nr:hypothetical protein [Ktedonobacteraceae bacterium]